MPDAHATTTTAYRRLPGRQWLRMTGRQRLYLGPDHILVVETHYMSEECVRFYFRDIHAITVVRTGGWAAWNVVLATAAALVALLALAASGGLAIFVWAVAGVFAAALVANLLPGPTCSCRIRTVVSERRLSAVERLRQADRLIAILHPLIEAAQATPP